ncbi:MAG: hypothetical protein R8M45_11365 [Ghiorsea sp.]
MAYPREGGTYEADKKGKTKLVERTQDADNGEVESKEVDHDSSK